MVVYSYYPRDQRVRREAETLTENGANIHVICLRNRGESRSDIHNNVTIHRVPMELTRRGGYSRYFLRYFLFLFLAAVLLIRLYVRYRYRVVHVHSLPDYLVFCAIFPKLLGAKIVLDLHELMPDIFAAKFDISMESRRVKIAGMLERLSMDFAHCTIVTSDSRRDTLQGRTHKKGIAVIMNMPKRDIYKSKDMSGFLRDNDLENSFIISYVGRLDPVRELEVVIKAIKYIGDKIPDIMFIFCGSGEKEYIASLEDLIRELGLEKKVMLMGYVPQEDILNYIELSNVSICPYKYYHNLERILDGVSSTKVFEYLLVPRPVIVTDLTSTRREFNGLVSFYKGGDHEHLGQRIIEVYSHQERFQEMAERAQEVLFERYDPEKNETRIVELYRSLLGR